MTTPDTKAAQRYIANMAKNRQLTAAELDIVRQWYNALVDVSPKYLAEADHVLGRKIAALVGAPND